MKKSFILLFALLFSITIFAQDMVRPTINGQFAYHQLDMQNMTYSVKLQINTDVPFIMEQVKTRFTFNIDGLDFINVNVLNLNGYDILTYLSQDGQKIWVEIDLQEGQQGYLVGTDFVDFLEFNFMVIDPTQWSNICLFASKIFRAVGVDGNLTIGNFPCDEYPLPVELTQFTVQSVNNVITLNWVTATELNNYGFEVERNYNGWQTIGFVQGYGNSSSPKYYSFEDTPQLNGTYQYRLKQLNNDGTYEYSNVVETTINVNKYALYQNYPNPFNPSTMIKYELKDAGNVQLKVYDIIGNEVSNLVDEYQSIGIHYVKLDASNLASGLYIYKLTVNDNVFINKMTLLK